VDFVTVTFHPMTSEQGGAAPILSPGFDLSAYRHLTTVLVVRDAGGTSPTLDITLEHSMDGENWFTLVTFPQATGPTTHPEVSSDFGRFVRARSQYGGTGPWFTYSLIGIARG